MMTRSFRRALAVGTALLSVSFVATAPAGAQMAGRPPVPHRLTLTQAEALLIQRNLPMAAAQRGIDIARAQRLIAGINPTVPVLSYSQNIATYDDKRDPQYDRTHWGLPWNSGAVTLSFLIERGGKLELRQRVADDQIRVAEAQLLDALRTQVGQLRQSFVTALQARANVDVYLANRASLDDTEKLIATQVKGGAVPEGDLVRFRASRLQYESDLFGALTSYEQAAADVLNALGSNARDVVPDPSPNDLPAPLARTSLVVMGNIASAPKATYNPDDLRNAADNRPDVVAARNSLSAADSSLELARAGRYSDVTVGPQISRGRMDTTAGIGFSIPVFNGRLIESNVMVAVGQREQAGVLAEQAKLQARTDVDKALETVRLSREFVQVYTGNALNLAEESQDISRKAFERGARSLLDLLDGQRTLNQTRVAANQARAAYLAALFQLEQAAGVDGLITLDNDGLPPPTPPLGTPPVGAQAQEAQPSPPRPPRARPTRSQPSQPQPQSSQP